MRSNSRPTRALRTSAVLTSMAPRAAVSKREPAEIRSRTPRKEARDARLPLSSSSPLPASESPPHSRRSPRGRTSSSSSSRATTRRSRRSPCGWFLPTARVGRPRARSRCSISWISRSPGGCCVASEERRARSRCVRRAAPGALARRFRSGGGPRTLADPRRQRSPGRSPARDPAGHGRDPRTRVRRRRPAAGRRRRPGVVSPAGSEDARRLPLADAHRRTRRVPLGDLWAGDVRNDRYVDRWAYDVVVESDGRFDGRGEVLARVFPLRATCSTSTSMATSPRPCRSTPRVCRASPTTRTSPTQARERHRSPTSGAASDHGLGRGFRSPGAPNSLPFDYDVRCPCATVHRRGGERCMP